MSLSTGVDRKVKLNRIVLISLILIIVLLVFFILFTRTEYFNLKEVNVVGNKVVEDDKIILASGIKYGVNIFDIDTKNLKSNIVNHPYIREVKLSRKFPNKFLISVVEREERFALNYLNSYLLVDRDGKILNVISEIPEIPIVKGIRIKNVKIGNNIELEDNIKTEVIKLINKCEKENILSDIFIIDFNNIDEVNILMKSGVNFNFGQTIDIEYCINILKEVNYKLSEKNINSGTVYIKEDENPYYSPNE